MSTDPLQLNSQYIYYIVHVAVPFTIATFFPYGLYTYLFIVYIQLQARYSQSRPRKRPLLFRVSIPFLFILVTLTVILSTISSYEGLKSQRQLELALGDRHSVAPPDSHYFRFQSYGMAGFALLGFVSILADFVLLYRAYTLWDRRVPIILLSALLLLLSLSAYICTVIYLKKESVVLFTDPFTVVETRLLLHMDYGIAISGLIGIVAIVVNNLALTTLIIYRVRKLTQVTNQFLPVSEQVHGGRLVKTMVGSYLLYGIGIIALRVGIIAGPIVDVFKLAPILALVIGISSTFLIAEVDLDLVGHPQVSEHAQDSPDVGGDAIESVQQSLSRDIV